MLEIKYSARMKRNLKNLNKQKKDMSKLQTVLSLLAEGKLLPAEYKDHKLSGEYKDCRECHIEPDWIFTYQIHADRSTLNCVSTGDHETVLS